MQQIVETEETTIAKEKEIPCTVHLVSQRGNFYIDDKAAVLDITKNSFTAKTRFKMDVPLIKNIIINFIEGNKTTISISGTPVAAKESDGFIVYKCTFPFSICAEKYINIHKPKEGAGHPAAKNHE